MMLSPEGFYETELKGKNREEILHVIRRLKRRIAMLKHAMEHPDYGTEAIMHPSEATRLWCTRLYLQRARDALAEIGAPCEPTKAELRVMDFDASIGNISRITLTIGGFFSGWRTYTVLLDDGLHFEVDDLAFPDIPTEERMTKEEFLDSFAALHVGEWRRHYDTERFGYVVLDGTQWELTIEYSSGRNTFTSGGSNAYPYNFRALTELLGIDEDT